MGPGRSRRTVAQPLRHPRTCWWILWVRRRANPKANGSTSHQGDGVELAPATRVEAGAPAASQARLKRELIAFLQELGRRTPVVLFVDDLHWADLPTADLVAYLGRHSPGLRLLVVVAYRRDELLLANHPEGGAMLTLQLRVAASGATLPNSEDPSA